MRRWKSSVLIAGLLAMAGCDDGDPVGGTPGDAEIRDSGGQGGMGGMPQGGEGGGGAGGEAGMGGGGAGGEAGMGGGGAGGEAGMGGGGAGGEPDMGMPPAPACSDEVDNDDDGLIDLDDPGCEGPDDDDETDPPILCANGVDDDGDGLIDLDDPGCTDGADFTEEDGPERPACANDADDDGDGAIDFPADVGCEAAGDDDETNEATPRACSNEVDDDGDGLTDYPFDPGCGGPGDNDETNPEGLPACGNGIDDDGDGAIDYPADNGCSSAGDYDERLICNGNGHQIVDLNAAIAADGYADGTTVDAQATEQGSCGGMAGGEQMFLYQVPERTARVVFTTEFEQTETPTVVYVRRACAGAEDLACNRGSREVPGTTAVLERPEAGPYYVIVDTSSRMIGAGAFRLSATAEDLPVCDDGLDNDEDGIVDFPLDPGCESPEDGDETSPDPLPACADGIDNDGDGAIDYPEDDDCEGAFDNDEQGFCGDTELPVVHVGQAGGLVEFVQMPNPDSVAGTCLFGSDGNETIVVLTLDQTSSVSATFDGSVARWVRTSCADPGSEVACESGFSDDPLILFRAEPGEYYFFVESDNNQAPGLVRGNFIVTPTVLTCSDGIDNDEDGLIDAADPGCIDADDPDETDPATPPVCNDGIDNDEDGDIDLADADCTFAGGTSEVALCDGVEANLIEVDRTGGEFEFSLPNGAGVTEGSCDDGGAQEQIFAVTFDERSHLTVQVNNAEGPAAVVLYARSECDAANSEVGCVPDSPARGRLDIRNLEAGTYFVYVERADFRDEVPLTAIIDVQSAITECNDEVDNDNDGIIDLMDPGCENGEDDSEADPAEVPDCADGLDNDEDGLIDYPEDFGCTGAGDGSESLACLATDNVVEVALDLENPAPQQFNFNTENQEGLFGASCGLGSESPEQVYALVVPQLALGFVEITDAGGRDTTLHIRAACDDASTELECNDDGGSGTLSRLEFRRLQPGVYYIFADGYGDRAGGPGTIVFDFTAAVVPGCGNGIIEGNEDCDDGNLDAGDGCDADCALEAEPEVGDLRLKDGIALGRGRLEVYANGEWGSVCDDNWFGNQEVLNGDIACQQLGYVGVREVLDGPAAPNAVPILLDEVDCVGNEERLIDCPANAIGDENCGHGEDIGLRCLLEGECRIDAHCDDGTSCFDGRCAVPQCADGADNDEDGQIDFPDDLGCTSLEDNDETNPACIDGEDNDGDGLIDFPADLGCINNEDNDEVNPVCIDGEDNDEDGLIDLDDPGCEGPTDEDETDPPELPACADGIDNDEDGMTDYPDDDNCIAAGDPTEGPQCNNGIDDDDDGRIDADDFGCESPEDDDEFLPVACGNGIIEGVEDCDDGNLEDGDGCSSGCALEAEPEQGDLRLKDGPAPDQGRLEVYANGVWGSVCDDNWSRDTLINADVACRQLGFPGAIAELDGPAAAEDVPTHLDDINCVGDEERLIDCPANAIGDENCSHFEDIGLRCLAVGACRIDAHCDDGNTCVEGRCGVAQCADGEDNDEDGVIDFPDDPGCVDSQDNDETNPACNDELDNDEDGAVDLNDPGCESLTDDDETDPEVVPACADGIDNDEDGVTDYPDDDDCTAAGDITEGPQCNNGIDDDNDGRIDADDFGCEDAQDDDEFLPVACGNGIIEGAEDCDDGNLENGDGCNEACVLEVEPEAGTLRLIDGPAPDQGRLEIYAAGAWGSVCDDNWSGDQEFINADIACQQLGFIGARETLDGPAADDAVPTHIDELNCAGDEDRLIDCPANPIGEENCSHFEDVGLRCLNPGECRIDDHCDGEDSCVEGRCGVPQCADGEDNDEDGATDLEDPGCVDAQDNDETNPACNDELDNDEDGLTDLADPGCVDLNDDDETDPDAAPACADEVDNDEDGVIDFPDDDDCSSAGDNSEGVCPGRGFTTVELNGDRTEVAYETVADDAGALTGSCGGGNAAEAVFRIELAEATDISFQIVGGFDTVLYVRAGCDDPASEVACDDDSGAGTRSRVELQAAAPGTYFVVADGYSGFGVPRFGPATLVITTGAAAANPRCSDGIDNDGDDLIDGDDPGCAEDNDDDETDLPVEP